MSDDSSSSASSSPPQARRRSSFAGQTFADLFGTSGASAHRGSISRAMSEYPPQQGPQYPNPITSAAAQAQRRRLSVTTLGLSGSPNQTSPFNSFRGRRDSDGGSLDESAVEDEVVSGGGGANPTPQTPLGRRMSFGARALRDVRTGGANGGGGTSPGQNGNNRPSATSAANAASPNNNNSSTISSRGDYAKGRGPSEGFNWSENFRTRAERTASGVGTQPTLPSMGASQQASPHGRSKSVAVVEPLPARELPKPKEQVRPDHFQERILKGDFYMD